MKAYTCYGNFYLLHIRWLGLGLVIIIIIVIVIIIIIIIICLILITVFPWRIDRKIETMRTIMH